jgi:hypothetical protein
MEAWEITYILVVFAGLMIGWQVNIYLGMVFIWVLVILAELLDTRKSKSHSHGQGHNLD